MLLQIWPAFFTRSLFRKFFFQKLGGAAYTRVRLIHECLRYSKAGLCPLWLTRKKAIWRNLFLYKMKQFHWLLCITRNCNWSRKITPLSNLTQLASYGMKTYSESRIELRRQLSFCHQSSLVGQKAWMFPWTLL